MSEHTSRLPGFYKRSIEERASILQDRAQLTDTEIDVLLHGAGLSATQADHMIENTVGIYSLPLGIATNFLINGRDRLIPMVIEEPSVVAAMSNAARLFREGGGFQTSSDAPIMIGQLQVLDLQNVFAAAEKIAANKGRLLAEVDSIGGSIIKRGGGARDIQTRPFPETPIGPMLVVHLLMDVRDAMGANAINTAAEHIAPLVEEITGGRVNLRILSNLTDQRKARAEGMIPATALATESMAGEDVARAVVEAGIFAEIDPYRAATHNKGIMNGVDAVIIATGNDWRAIEAGAHAYAARSGHYTSLSHYWQDENGNLHGELEMPLSVGIVGGATRVHPAAQVALKILGVSSAQELAEICAAAGLAQNFAALRALASEGIQRGHMRMHAKQIALSAGAAPEQVSVVVDQMIRENNIRPERAKAIIESLKG